MQVKRFNFLIVVCPLRYGKKYSHNLASPIRLCPIHNGNYIFNNLF